jgi:hypothetical protein
MGEHRLADDNPERPELESVRPGGTRTAAAIGAAIVVALGVLLWQPWAGATPPAARHDESQSTAFAQASGPSVAGAASSATPSATGAPDASQAPTLLDATPVAFRSLVDNEWTIVALLTPGSTASEEPVIPHVPPPAWSPDGPFLVLQQGLGGASTQRRARPAVHLPADRVVYLGLTFPGMSGSATISAAVLGASGATVARVDAPVVLLDGVTPAGRYVLPSAGLGGVVLFSSTRPAVLPTDAYRFEVSLPGTPGSRYLYACIGT